MLKVARPTVEHEDAGGGAAALEKPATVRVATVASNGTALGPPQLSAFGVFAYRRRMAGAALEIWDDNAKKWRPDPGAAVSGLGSTPLSFKESQPTPWEAIVVAAGGQDADGQSQYARAAGGYPLYSFRAWFQTKEGRSALSEATDPVRFVGVADRNLVVLGAGDDQKPEQATQARVGLKNPALQIVGQLLIERDTPGGRLSLANAAGASIVIRPDGAIEIRPAPGQKVIVAGALDAGPVTYLTPDGITRKALL